MHHYFEQQQLAEEIAELNKVLDAQVAKIELETKAKEEIVVEDLEGIANGELNSDVKMTKVVDDTQVTGGYQIAVEVVIETTGKEEEIVVGKFVEDPKKVADKQEPEVIKTAEAKYAIIVEDLDEIVEELLADTETKSIANGKIKLEVAIEAKENKLIVEDLDKIIEGLLSE